MRVLWVVKGLGPGGAERLLAAAARAHRPDLQLECAYVLPWKDHLAAELEGADVRTHCLSVRRVDRRWPVRLAGLIRDGGYSVVHVHSPLPGSVARLAVRSMRHSRPGLVSTEHNRWETHRFPTRALNRLTGRFDDASFAVTDEVRDSMSRRARERAVTLRHGIEVDRVAARTVRRRGVRADLGIDPDELVVGTVANFRPQKDYPTLLRSAKTLADRDVPLRMVAVGQGPQEAEIRSLHRSLDLGDRVVLTGFRADAVDVLAACDAFTLASRWEGLPVAVMEALALGLPIVATAVGGVAEELTDGVDAVLVPPGDPDALADALERVATDPDLRVRLAAASAARAGDFDVARTVAVLEAAYDRVARPSEPFESPRPRPAAGSGFDLRPAEPDDRDAILALLRRSLGGDGDPRYPDLFAWKHDRNRFGPSPMWVATDAGQIVAFRAFMRWEFVRGGHVLRAVRAVDTATDPEYQGRGLFRALTMHALDAMRVDAVDFVFNTPNSQSRPGYLKMGWRDVGRLPAAVRFTGPSGVARAARSQVPAERWSTGLDVGVPVGDWLAAGGPGDRWPQPVDVREIRTNGDDEFLAWRFGTPLLGYRAVDDGDTAIIVRGRRRGASRELAVVAEFGESAAAMKSASRAARRAGCDYAIRIGSADARCGYVPLPGGGPILTWRAVGDTGFPPLANWALTLGDVELF